MGNCCAYPARLLGQSLVVQNVPFVFGPTIPAGTAAPWNAISGGGARITIQLPRGRFSSLQMLGTAFGAQIAQQFQLNYADGGSSTFTQSLSDWFSPQGFQGEGNALNMPYFLAENGVGYIPDVYLYSYGFNLDNCRIVASLTLPANAGVEILALTLVPTVTSSPTICGVQNAAASVNPTILTPGTFATIFGLHLAAQPAQAIGTPFPVTLGGVSVAVNGTPAPLYYVSPTQINFVVPWEVTGTQATIIVQGNGNSSNSMSVAIAPSAPYIFTVNQQGTGQADALIVGTTSLAAPVGAFPGSRPVQRGEYISLYATGLGAVQGPPQDGSASSGPSPTVQPVYVNISNVLPKPLLFCESADHTTVLGSGTRICGPLPGKYPNPGERGVWRRRPADHGFKQPRDRSESGYHRDPVKPRTQGAKRRAARAFRRSRTRAAQSEMARTAVLWCSRLGWRIRKLAATFCCCETGWIAS